MLSIESSDLCNCSSIFLNCSAILSDGELQLSNENNKIPGIIYSERRMRCLFASLWQPFHMWYRSRNLVIVISQTIAPSIRIIIKRFAAEVNTSLYIGG